MTEIAQIRGRTPRSSTVALVAGFVLLACVALRAVPAMRNLNSLNIVSGSWTALAMDLAHDGEFYRPLVSEDGYGGTRFFPLQFVCHAFLIRLGIDPFVAGTLLGIAWTTLLLTGMYAFLKRSGVDVPLAAAGALAGLASASAFVGLTDIRGDILPAALNVWGLALLISYGAGTRRIGCAAICFALAFSAKITTVYGFGAGLLALLLGRQYKDALRLFVLTAMGYAIVLLSIYLLSGGRIVEIFQACASGNTDIKFAVQAPIRLVEHYFGHDPIGTVLVIAALAAVTGMLPSIWREMSVWAMVGAMGITLLIFASPGTSYNHLIDLNILALLLLISLATIKKIPHGLVAGMIAMVCITGGIFNLQKWRDEHGDSRRREMQLAVAEITSQTDGPILSQDPLIPIFVGQRVYALDAWMLRVFAQRDLKILQNLQNDIRNHKFSAIVLTMDPQVQNGRYVEERVFGPGFVAAMRDSYRHGSTRGRFRVFVPDVPRDRLTSSSAGETDASLGSTEPDGIQ